MLPDLAVTAVRRKCQTATREQSLGRPLGNRWRFPWTVLFQGVDEDFFPPPPSAREPESRPPSPEWMGPPYGVLPGAVALEVVLAENEQAAVYIGRCDAYPTGLDFELHVLAAASAGDLDPSLNGIYQRPGGGSTYEKMLRFGVAFADGRKGSNLAGFTAPERSPRGLSCGEWVAAAEAGAGIRASGCGRSRRSVRCFSSANGRRQGFPSPASRSIRSHSAMPPGARVSCSPIRPLRSGAAPGHGGSQAREPASRRTRIRSDQRRPSKTAAFTNQRACSRVSQAVPGLLLQRGQEGKQQPIAHGRVGDEPAVSSAIRRRLVAFRAPVSDSPIYLDRDRCE